MRTGILGSLLTLLTAVGWTPAQSTPGESLPNPSRSAPGASAATVPAVSPGAEMPLPAMDTLGAPGSLVPGGDASSCAIPGRFWGGVEYLMWWTRDDHAPPLLTTGPLPLPVGVLGNSTTSILLGGGHLDQETFSGARFTAGMWLGACNSIGVEGSYFFLGEKTLQGAISSASVPILARPFFNLNTGVQSSAAVAIPGTSTGQFGFSHPSRFQGFELNGIANTFCCGNCRIDLIGGFRYLDLTESLNLSQSEQLSPNLPDPALAGNRTLIAGNFATQNHFYGGQVGLGVNWIFGPLLIDLRGKVALGGSRQQIAIDGSRQVTTATGFLDIDRSQFALPSNIGTHERDQFTVVPEVGVNVGYQLTHHIGLFAGYTFLSYYRVVRPGEQIDLVTDVTQIPNPANPTPPANLGRPAVLFNQSAYWAQGLNFGLEIVW